ncbi:MAG: hypothetical protein AB1505_29085 [Candidatus Latescibacterota bacterium]
MHSTDPGHPSLQVLLWPPGGRAGVPFSTAATRLRLGVETACTWGELGQVAQAIDVAYSCGELDLGTALELAESAVQASRLVPPGEAADGAVWAEDLLDPDRGGSCPCCGQETWWEKDGELVCGTCHPQPAWGQEEALTRRTAA